MLKFFERELSQLEFTKRVVHQASDKKIPILERLKYLCIASANLDEFFEIKVAALRKRLSLYSTKDRLDSHEFSLLKSIRKSVNIILKKKYALLQKSVFSALRRKNIVFLRRRELNSEQKTYIKNYFRKNILPIISPISLDGPTPSQGGSHPFPKVQNKSLNFMVKLTGQDAFGRTPKLAVVTAPRVLPRFFKLPKKYSNGKEAFMFLSSIIHENISDLFPGLKVRGCHQFRVTMNSNLVFDDEDLQDLKLSLTKILPDRIFNEAIRLEVVKDCPRDIINFLKLQYELNESDIYKLNGPVNLHRLFSIYDELHKPELKFPQYKPNPKNLLSWRPEKFFNKLKLNDLLLHHPYDDFKSVINFLKVAVQDPKVIAIKQTIYRSEKKSPIIDLLIKAAKKNIAVTVVIELRAKFDEENNINIAKRLEKVGAQVTYGILSYKTHAKALLVIRKENKTLQHYFHLGTGNYNYQTAKLYTDYGILSSNNKMAEDVQKFFMQLTGSNKKFNYNHLILSPFDASQEIIKKVNNEIKNCKKGREAIIKAKMNQLTEINIIKKLYQASSAGVKIELHIRGECRLIPGVKGISDNIKVYSTIGRFLEHSRVYYFYDAGKEQVYLSSADWMTRNMHNRVEIIFPILEKNHKSRIYHECFIYSLEDNSNLWKLKNNGTYDKVKIERGSRRNLSQDVICNKYGEFID